MLYFNEKTEHFFSNGYDFDKTDDGKLQRGLTKVHPQKGESLIRGAWLKSLFHDLSLVDDTRLISAKVS